MRQLASDAAVVVERQLGVSGSLYFRETSPIIVRPVKALVLPDLVSENV